MSDVIHSMKDIPASVFDRAEEMVIAQSYVPMSPGRIDGSGRIALCAAAVLASAGLRVLRSEADGELFDQQVISSGSKLTIERAFQSLRWSTELCWLRLDENDRADEHMRKPQLLCLLSKWKREASVGA